MSFINGLVKLSATISALGTKLTVIRFRLYKSRILVVDVDILRPVIDIFAAY